MKNLDSQGVCASLIIIIQIEGMSLSWPSHEALAHRVLARPFLTFTQPPHQQLLDVAAPRLARLSRRVSLRLLARSRPNMISRTSSGITERTLGAFWSVEANLGWQGWQASTSTWIFELVSTIYLI